MLTGWLYRFHICKLLCISNFVGGGRKRLFIVHRTFWPSACTVIVFVTWYRHVLSVHKSVNKKKHWIKQVIDQYFFHHCIMTLIPSVTVARTYYVRSVSSMLKNLETVQVPGLHLKRNYLVTRRKFKLTKLERKKIHYYKDKLCATWYRCFHRRPSSDE